MSHRPCEALSGACPNGAPPRWTALCDFDGTVSTIDVTDHLLATYARRGWETLEARWARGEIGSRECLAGQVALLDLDEVELEAALDTIPIDPGFPDFVAAVERRGIALTIVSDGLDRAIAGVLRRHGLERLPIRANRLVQVAPRGWRLEFPYQDDACRSASGNCKCALARVHAGIERVLYIGDGTSDICVAPLADRLLAKEALLEHARRTGLPYIAMRSFVDATAALDVLDQPLHAAEAAM